MGNLHDELRRVRQTRFAAVPRVFEVARLLLASRDVTCDAMRMITLEWAAQKWPGLISTGARAGENFEVLQAGLNLSAAHVPGKDIWAFRSEHIANDAARTWVTEVLVSTVADQCVFGLRNLSSSLSDLPPPASVPRLVRDALLRFAFADAEWRVQAAPVVLENEADAESLAELLVHRDRNLPVNVLSLDRAGVSALDAAALARQCAGIAHVVVANDIVTRRLSSLMGPEWSVYNGAVRTYHPRLEPSRDDWRRHPLVLASRIGEYEFSGERGAAAFLAFLVNSLCTRSAAPTNTATDFPDFFAVKNEVLRERARNANSADLIPILEEELTNERRNSQRWQDYAVELSEGLEIANSRILELQAQHESLFFAFEGARKARGAEEPDPSSFAEMALWVERALAGRLKLHARAVRALKSASYENPGVVAEALKLLAFEYRNMRLATSDSGDLKRAFDERLGLLGLERSGSISKERAGEFESEYFIDYVIGQSVRQYLAEHLKRGSSKDERYCLRIYYFWDPEQEIVVVGSLPGHLRNRQS